MRRPHMAHVNKSACRGGESTIHRLAKEGVAGVLTRGGSLEFLWNCPTCLQRHSRILCLQQGESAVVEGQVSNGRADVAVMNTRGAVRFVVEVANTHTTQSREEEWVEVSARECLKQVTKDTRHMTLWCLRERIPKHSDKCWVSLCDHMGYKEDDQWTLKQKKLVCSVIWKWFIRVGRCLKCFNPHCVNYGRPFCKPCYTCPR